MTSVRISIAVLVAVIGLVGSGLSADPPAASAAGDEQHLKRWWEALAAEKPLDAIQAQETLIKAGGKAVEFLKTVLKPAAKVPEDVVKQLLKDLAEGEFKTRQKALAELAKLAPQIEARLQQAMEKAEDPDFKQSLADLLKPSPSTIIRDPDLLRNIRAVRVLEEIEDAGAIELLEQLSKGDPDSPLTKYAKGALRRVKQQS